MPNCFATFMTWSARRWATAGLIASLNFVIFTLVGQLFSTGFGSDNPFAQLTFAIPFSLLSGLYVATYLKDSSYFPDSKPHKWFGLAITLAVFHYNTALIGFVLMMWTVRGRIMSESACSLPTPNK